MPIWFDADGKGGGHVAIYTGNDDAPMANPAAYIGTRTKFSTKFNYIPFVPAKRIVGNVFVPSSIPHSGRQEIKRVIDLGAHGAGGVPFIYGFATVNGVILPLCGSIPVRRSESSGDCILWTLGVNASNVLIAEARSFPSGWGDFSVPVEVFVSDKLVA